MLYQKWRSKMKRLVLSVLVLFATMINAENVPEFDGAYIKTKDGKFIELAGDKGGYIEATCSSRKYKTLEGTVELDNFKGIHINGQHDYTLLSFKSAGWHNSGMACTFKEIKIKAKSRTNSAYFESKDKLKKGFYGVKIGKSLWFFYITNKNGEAIIEKARQATMKLWKSKEVFVGTNNKLLWQDNIEAKKVKRNFSDAKNYCQGLTFAGKKDWRLPTEEELLSILSNKNKSPGTVDGIKNVANSRYWSSSKNKYGDTLGVDLSAYWHKPEQLYTHNENHVRCVRDIAHPNK